MTNLECILCDLNRHKRDKKKLLMFYIEKRLSDSLVSYYKELSTSVKYLNQKQNITVLNQLNKI